MIEHWAKHQRISRRTAKQVACVDGCTGCIFLESEMVITRKELTAKRSLEIVIEIIADL